MNVDTTIIDAKILLNSIIDILKSNYLIDQNFILTEKNYVSIRKGTWNDKISIETTIFKHLRPNIFYDIVIFNKFKNSNFIVDKFENDELIYMFVITEDYEFIERTRKHYYGILNI